MRRHALTELEIGGAVEFESHWSRSKAALAGLGIPGRKVRPYLQIRPFIPARW